VAGFFLVLRADQIGHRLISGDKGRVQRVSGKEISVAGAQDVSLVTNPQLKLAGKNPVRLIFGVRVRAILCARRVAPLKDTVAFLAQTRFQLLRIWRSWLTPTFYFNAHELHFAIKEINTHVRLCQKPDR